MDDCPALLLYAFAVRAYITFQHRKGWAFAILRDDLRAQLTRWHQAASEDALLRIIAKLNGSTEQASIDMHRWARGGVWIDLSPSQCHYFRIG